MLTVTTLASGSAGNAVLVSGGSTHILLDAGISARKIRNGLAELGVDPGELSAVFITHEHSDHIGGLRVLTKKLRVPISATPATCRVLAGKLPDAAELLVPQKAGTGRQARDLWVESFSTPHDAAGSVGYSVSDGTCRLVLCTDLGRVTDEVAQAVRGCDLLLCETNHDPEWVRTGPYPPDLKRRILGDRGHLSNEAGAALCALAAESGARTAVLAHLSAQNNTPAHAKKTVCRLLKARGIDPERDIRLSVAPRDMAGTTFRLERRGEPARSERGHAPC